MAAADGQQKHAVEKRNGSKLTELNAPDYDTWVNRFAAYLVKGLAWTRLSPGHLTVMGLAFGLGAGTLFAFGETSASNVGAFVFMLAVFMDELDGALARASGRVTRFGHLLDYALGTASFCALFVGAGIGAHQEMGAWGPILGAAAAVAAMFSMWIRFRMEDRHGRRAVMHKRLGPFELKDGIYLVGPATWVGGLHFFFIAAAISTCIFAFWTMWQRKLWLVGAEQLIKREDGTGDTHREFEKENASQY